MSKWKKLKIKEDLSNKLKFNKGLDPAGPLFSNSDTNNRLDKSDAE